jgi:hypothetical protein
MSRFTSITSIVLGIILSLFVAYDAQAQWNVARFDANQNRTYSSFGLDPALVSAVGYGRVVSLFDHQWQVTGEVGVVAAKWDTRDFRTRLGTQTSLVRWGSFNVAGSATFITRGTTNAIYHGFNIGADMTGTFGWYRPRWFAGGEFGLDKAIITHVKHTDYYRRYFYPDAKDGWYLDAGGTYHYGVTSGLALGRTELVARAGFLRTERFKDQLPPMYASLGVGFGF